MTKFELRRLESYDEDALLAEIQRVAALVDTPHISQEAFNRLTKASSSAIRRHFGSWEKALDRAGLRHRYSGAPVSKRLLAHGRRTFTDEQLVQELKDVSLKLNGAPVHSESGESVRIISARLARRRERRAYEEED